jgi:ATP-dependent Clp protease ATP-binding subunit ClpA
MGARPMARLIQDTIRSALADELLFGRLVNGGKVTIDLDDEKKVKLVFHEEEEAPAPA